MLGTSGSELLSRIDSDPAWKVSKGRRSASRRARKTISTSFNKGAGLICRSSEGTNMPVSESEKHGVSVLGCRFSEKAENVPIKKRRFLFRPPSPSPPPPSPPPSPPRPVLSSPSTEEIADLIKGQEASNELAAAESASCDVNMSHIIDNIVSNDEKKSEKVDGKLGEEEDFCGISILAAAACSSSLGKQCGNAEGGSGGEECSTQERTSEICFNAVAPSSARGLFKEDHVNSSEMSTGGTSSCESTELVGDLASFPTTTAGKGIKGSSSWAGSLTLSSDVSCSKDEDTVGNQRPTSRNQRFHWDLNVVMDAWEDPFEDPDAPNDVTHKNSEESDQYNLDDNRASYEGPVSQDRFASTCVEQLSGKPGTMTIQTLEGSKENHVVGASDNVAQSISLDKKSPSNCSNDDLDVVKCMIEDTRCMRNHETVNNIDGLALTASNLASSQPSTSGTMNEDEDLSARNLTLSGGRHLICSPADEGLNSCADARCDTATVNNQLSLCVSSSSYSRRDVISNLAVVEDLVTSQGILNNGNAVVEKVDLKTSQPLGDAHVEANRNDIPHSSTCAEEPNSASTKCELLVDSDATKVQVVSDVQGKNLVYNSETAMNYSEIPQIISKQTCEPICHDPCKTKSDNNLSFSDKIHMMEPRDHSSTVDVYCPPVSVIGTEAVSECQVDDDSQYEDGELRETNEHTWDECYVDREAEHVDYGSDKIETCTANSTDYYVSETDQAEEKNSGGLGVSSVVSSTVWKTENEVCGKLAEKVGDDGTWDELNKLRLSHSAEDKMKAPSSTMLLESSKSFSDMTTVAKDDNERSEAMCSYGDGLVDSRATDTRRESRTFKRDLRSQIEGPISRDVSSREERLKLENRFDESSSMRSFERVRYPFHNRGRGRQGDSWDGSFDGRRGFRRHYSPIRRGQSKLDDDAIVERNDIGCVDMQNDVSYSHQLLPKSRPVLDQDTCVGLHSHCNPDRKFSPDRATFGRGRSFRYGAVDSRAGRGRYNGPSLDESFQSSLKYRRPLSRGERSCSPIGGRGRGRGRGRGHFNAHHSRGKSPSRSRSRSPNMWNSQRGRPGAGGAGNTFLRHRSRSPNFRSEIRMQRLRSPHQQPGFGADHAMGFRSMPRKYGSPPRNRWASSRKDELGHCRDFGYKQRTSALERSPGRIRLRDDRAGGTDSPRNIKPDGYYRISDRISEDGAGRGLNRISEENYEERRKHFGPLRPARRSYEDGMPSRLHQDTDDGYPMANNVHDRIAPNFEGRRLRSIDCRIGDVPRNFRGEQHSFKYERDGKFNSNPKQFGVDVMDSSRNLQTEEQYQSNHTGRFTAMDGPKFRTRYENI